MVLPAQVRTWMGDNVNLAEIAENGVLSVSIYDMSGVSNMDELWQLTVSGQPLLAGFQYSYSGTRWLPTENSINSVARKSLPNVAIPPDSLVFPKGLEHLIRR